MSPYLGPLHFLRRLKPTGTSIRVNRRGGGTRLEADLRASSLRRFLEAAGFTGDRRMPALSQMGVWPWFSDVNPPENDGRPISGGSLGGRNLPGDGVADFGTASESVPFYHESVLLQEVIDFLDVAPGRRYLDVTLGGGGHSEGILAQGASVVAIDQDPVAIAHATSRLRGHAQRFSAIRANFRDFPDVLSEIGVQKFDGILADLGISSKQLDDPAKGFSFMHDGPLDLRMNPDAAMSAADLVNTWPEEELRRILIEYGEEPQARRIARAIVQRRDKKPVTTTLELADIVLSVCPRKGHRHPATLTFQALRIAVNDELGALIDLLEAAPKWLNPGGRIAIISFHSLEDRIVKRAFQRYAAKEIDRPEWPAPRPNPDYCLEIITRKPVEPSPEEVARNPRSRSARLRVAERSHNKEVQS